MAREESRADLPPPFDAGRRAASYPLSRSILWSPMRRIGYAFILLLLPSLALGQPAVTALRYWTAPDHTRVVLDLDGEYSFDVSTRENPERVVINLAGARFDCATDVRAVGDELIHRLRCNPLKKGAQIVLDLKKDFEFKYFALKEVPGRKPQRLVIDVFPRSRDGSAATAVSQPTPGRSPFGRDVIVVIDAGHGGEDPGAILNGKREKDITLDIAKRLASKLQEMPGYRPVLTRKGDYSLSLAQRREMADRVDGDLLISVHCNTAPSRSASGAEIFMLSTRGATSRRAQTLADLENSADLIGGVHPRASREEVKLVLDKSLEAVLDRSRLFAEVLHKKAGDMPGIRAQRRLKRANFGICRVVSMPAVLVEVGFMSNTRDWKILTSKNGRQQLADWLATGVDTYFHKYSDTLFDPLFSSDPKLVYLVKRGDNLSSIAKRFGVSVGDLVSVNHLPGRDHLAVGQKLLVAAESLKPIRYRVQRGDTLSAIARRYGVTITELIDSNGIEKRNQLRVGQELLIRAQEKRGRSD